MGGLRLLRPRGWVARVGRRCGWVARVGRVGGSRGWVARGWVARVSRVGGSREWVVLPMTATKVHMSRTYQERQRLVREYQQTSVDF